MKKLSQNEISGVAKDLQDLLDAKAQKVFVSNHGIGLELFKNNQSKVLWFEMQVQSPCLCLFNEMPNFIGLKKTSPLFLFLKAHLIGKRLSEVKHLKEWGRVLEFDFGYDEILKLQVILIPHRANIIASYQAKKISLEKPRPLEKFENQTLEQEGPRSLTEITSEWISEQTQNKLVKIDPATIKEKQVQKKEKVLAKIEEQITNLESDPYKKIGNWLKNNQSLDVPKEFLEFIQKNKTLSWNIQNSFEKAKKVKEKLEGTLERKKQIERELLNLKNSDAESFNHEEQKKTQVNRNKSNWKGHRFNLNSKVEVFVGRNATENLQILRYAQSWDYWLHLKDYPGAHGIIRRPRNMQISDEDIKKVAKFVASKSKKSVHFLKIGDSFEVICAQCRFVRPIKGDKLGRVTYSNEQTFLCTL